MSVQEKRRERKSADVNLDKFEFTAEKEGLPNLHAGFTEECTKQQGKSAFFMSIWFSQGQYKACLLDRESEEKAFFNIGELLHAFSIAETALEKDLLEWIPANDRQKGSWHN